MKESEAKEPVPATRARKSASHEHPGLDLSALDGYLGFHMKRTDAVVFQHFSRLTPRRRMVRGEVAILMLIQFNPGSSQDAVCRAAGLDKSSISLALSKLESRKLIERRGADDKRVRTLYLTAAGRAFLKRMSPVIDTHEREIAGRLTAKERAELIRLLSRVFETVNRIRNGESGTRDPGERKERRERKEGHATPRRKKPMKDDGSR